MIKTIISIVIFFAAVLIIYIFVSSTNGYKRMSNLLDKTFDIIEYQVDQQHNKLQKE